MNLVIDFGNTSAKAGLFEENRLIKVIPDVQPEALKDIYDQLDPKHIIVSTVSKSPDEIRTILPDASMIFLSPRLHLPFEIAYQTPETLGLDRIAAVAGAQEMLPDSNCLVIDAGTCFTYDILDSKGVYHGGGISPGLKMRFRALNNFTANLPLVEIEDNVPLVGQTTKNSILSGVINGAVAEMTEIIRMYRDKFADLQIIICGGDARFFENKLKESIFVTPDLVLRGLNRILLYNV